MKILYCASDQVVPGTIGGSVHVAAVAEGLAALGHDVHVLATPGGEFPAGRVAWSALPPPLGRKELRWANAGAVRKAAESFHPDVIMERYYNFGGEGIAAAARLGATAVLEVNAPIVDYAGSAKRLLDRALIVEPMRRWRDRMCARSDLIVTSSSSGAPTRIGFTPARRGRFPSRVPPAPWRCSPARSAAGTGRCTWPPPSASFVPADGTMSARCSSGMDPNGPACARRPRGSRA
jgi:hypothetical protein